MSPLDLITAILGVPLIAGAIGGAIRWAYLKENRFQGSSSLLIGAFVAHYVSLVGGQWFTAFADFSQVDPASGRATLAFMIGIGGIWPVQWVVDFSRRRAEMLRRLNEQGDVK